MSESDVIVKAADKAFKGITDKNPLPDWNGVNDQFSELIMGGINEMLHKMFRTGFIHGVLWCRRQGVNNG